ncbi:MAG: hypothetical protein NT166_22285 [Candidatus Aminicenantes bacterium]|nr:hypothetical protein [Candidatus Aminicenantes bacterium]
MMKDDIQKFLFWVIGAGEEAEVILRDMVTNNILYFDPPRAVYYPQDKSYHWGNPHVF